MRALPRAASVAADERGGAGAVLLLAVSWIAAIAGIALVWAAVDSPPLIIDALPDTSFVSVGFVSDSELLGAIAGVLLIVGGLLRRIRSGARMAVVLLTIAMALVLCAVV